MKDPELRAAEEELREAWKKVQAARLKSWGTHGPNFERRLHAFIVSLQWGALLGQITAFLLSNTIMNRSLPRDFRIHTGLEWLSYALALALLIAPIVLRLKVPWSKFFVREFVLGAFIGYTLVSFLLLKEFLP